MRYRMLRQARQECGGRNEFSDESAVLQPWDVGWPLVEGDATGFEYPPGDILKYRSLVTIFPAM